MRETIFSACGGIVSTRICIVEDENIVAFDIKRHLERAGYEVVGVFSTGEEALNSFGQLMPDLVLMDVRLGGKIDGIETARLIRERHDRPVVMLTAYADDSTVARAKESGPFGYLLKPFEERELKTTVEIALYRYDLERRLRESKEQYRLLFEEDLSGDFFADPSGTIRECNPAFADIFGYKNREEAQKANLNDLFPDDESRARFWENLASKKKLSLMETGFLTADKRRITILANVIGTFNRNGELTLVKGYLIDITEMKELEVQLRQSQKLEAIGRLAGGVAHDFNNILTVITGYSVMMGEKIREGIAVESDIEGITKAARKATALTRQLLAFSRKQILEPRVTDINELVTDMDRMLRRILVKDIVMHIRLDAQNPKAFVDPGQIEQVLMNLVVNAKDAMPNGGKLLVSTRNQEVPRPLPSSTGKISPGDYIVLQVTDTGIGIPESIIHKIFDPFFTTKAEDRGTGLGLSTVYGIVKQSGGFIQVTSEVNKGSDFSVFLPVTERDISEQKGERRAAPRTRGTETLLLVENEEDVRQVIAGILARSGYSVLEADNPGEAILIAEAHGPGIDLLISDTLMQHISGIQLSERLRELKPGLKVILMSGYHDRIVEGRGEAGSDISFIAKPLDPEQFLITVRSVLDSR